MSTILYRLHTAQPLEHEVPQTLLEDITARLKFSLHVTQRTARILGTLLLRAFVKHPLGWTLPQEVVCLLMYGILQSRQVPAWRAFFTGVGDLAAWVPVVRQQVTTGSCSSWWIRLPPDQRPKAPIASINWLWLHGGAFVAGDALMYTRMFSYWMLFLAKQDIDCSFLSVEYPLAPEHPFPAGLNAAVDAVQWLLTESGDTRDYVMGGDSAGGNLALGALSLLRDAGLLTRPPVALTLISPAVDLSNASVFGTKEPVSSHFEDPAAAAAAKARLQHRHMHGHAAHSHSHCSSHSHGHCSSHGSSCAPKGVQQQQQQQREHPGVQCGRVKPLNVAQHQLQLQHMPLESQPSVDCTMHAAHTAGGQLRPLQLLRSVVRDVTTTIAVHSSSSRAAQQAAYGYFDYLPPDSLSDELHCYLPEPGLLSHPLVSPTYMNDFTGLASRAMLVLAGGAEIMRPDIKAFADKVAAAAAGGGPEATTASAAAAAPADSTEAAAAAGGGCVRKAVRVVYHEEPGEPHVYPALMMPHLLRKGLVVPGFVAEVVREEGA